MKRILSFCIIALFAIVFQVNAKIDPSTPLPIDSAVRYGKLSNGLTYYIRHNSEPKNRADFYIAQKVGSILEEENQKGLAHFLEHMAFNGTTNFPGKSMLEYLQNNGLKFGRDINAYTSFDETVYYISNVNTQNVSLMDSTLLALYDWGNEISLLDQEIDNERGVITEEWRTRGNAQMRMFEKVLPILYKGSKYADRLPIGSMDVVQNFKYQTIRDYYEKWYRPDQQGIIIVGDFNADEMEKKVQMLFSRSVMPFDAAKREYFNVPNNKEPLIAVFGDPEASFSMISIYFKHDTTPVDKKNSVQGYTEILTNALVQTMFADRFNEIAQKPDAPFNYAGANDGNFLVSVTKDAFNIVGIAKENKVMETLQSVLTEAQRAKLHGFTQSELDRAKAKISAQYERQYNERDKNTNENLAQEYVQNFTEGMPAPGISTEYSLSKQLLPILTLNDVNNFVKGKLTNDNIAVLVSGPEKEGIVLPTEKQISKELKAVLASTPTAYEEKILDTNLLSNKPISGSIVSETTIPELGMTELILSNGVKVQLKPTDFKNDEIIMTAISKGGMWGNYNGKNALDLNTLEDVVNISALGKFNRSELRKVLAGKNASVGFVFGEPTENISANSTKKDLETMLQLNYLYFTDVNKDNETFEAYKSSLKSQLAMRKNNPRSILSDTIQSKLYDNSPLYKFITPEQVDSINYDYILDLYKNSVGNAKDFTFSFVGNFNVDSIKPMIAEYIASLPNNGATDSLTYIPRFPKFSSKSEFKVPMVNPTTTCYGFIYGSVPYSLKNDFMLDMLNSIMRIVYTNTIREEEGGTYGVGTSTSLSKYTDEWSFSYFFDTNAEAQQRLNARTLKELDKVMTEGADESEFRKAKEAAINQYENDLRSNNYWMSVLRYRGIGMDIFTNYKEIINNLTLAEFNDFMKSISKKTNTISIVMEGEKAQN